MKGRHAERERDRDRDRDTDRQTDRQSVREIPHIAHAIIIEAAHHPIRNSHELSHVSHTLLFIIYELECACHVTFH